MKYYVYSDIDENLSSNFVFDVDAIKQSVRTILTTPKGSRMFRADFGCNLEDYLHELADHSVAFQIYNENITAIYLWEPRVLIDASQSSVSLDGHVYRVRLVFSIVGLGDSKFQHVLGLSK